ncbi:MAG: hypothetical protein IKC03_04040 [Oscillospiraceae bacterium]|nr:hypothetical protein [Oscillospiraceae bacterium]
MDKETIVSAMNHIDETLVAEAAAVQQTRHRTSWKRVALIAACLCTVLTVSVAALIGSGALLRLLHDHKYVGLKQVKTDDLIAALYGAESTVRISVDELSDDIKKLAMEQTEETEWYLFSSWIGMEMCLGMDVAYNSVLMPMTRYKQSIPGSSIEDENFDYGLMRISKDLSNIRMHESYKNGDYSIRVVASVTTDAEKEPQTDDNIIFNGMFRSYTEKELENLTVEEYTMANGCTASIVSELGLEYNPIRSYSAFFQTDKALIAVYVDYPTSTLEGTAFPQHEIDTRNDAILAQLKLVLDGFR